MGMIEEQLLVSNNNIFEYSVVVRSESTKGFGQWESESQVEW